MQSKSECLLQVSFGSGCSQPHAHVTLRCAPAGGSEIDARHASRTGGEKPKLSRFRPSEEGLGACHEDPVNVRSSGMLGSWVFVGM